MFSFINPRVDIITDSIGAKVPMDADPLEFRIHSYIDVWPGDADNSGYVDVGDGLQIGLFFEMGSPTNAMRSFKRPDASTLWTPQRCLAWDSSIVTHADCDGNGIVTATDILVMRKNFQKSHSKTGKTDLPQIRNKYFNNEKIQTGENSIRIPIIASGDQPILAAALTADLSALDSDYEVLGIQPGDVFTDPESFLYYKINSEAKRAQISAGTYSDKSAIPGARPIAWLIVEGPGGAGEYPGPLPAITASGLSPDGFIFPIAAYTSAEDDQPQSEYIYSAKLTGSQLSITGAEGMPFDWRICDISGRTLARGESDYSAVARADVSQFGTGVYFAIISASSGSKVIPFNILR